MDNHPFIVNAGSWTPMHATVNHFDYAKTSGWIQQNQERSDKKFNISGQIILIHQARFPWNKGISLTKPPFGVTSAEVTIIWPDI